AAIVNGIILLPPGVGDGLIQVMDAIRAFEGGVVHGIDLHGAESFEERFRKRTAFDGFFYTSGRYACSFQEINEQTGRHKKILAAEHHGVSELNTLFAGADQE